ncbi:MAG: hypothetical protein LCH76_10650 [Actinobacteria bacterium]|nr:hypothetical protein [Actinomycetota bacterium]
MPTAAPGGLRWAAIRAAVRRGLLLTLVLVVLGGLAGGALGWSQQRYSEADATILLNPLNGNPFSTTGRGDNLTNLETEAELVRSFEVGEMVRAETGTTDTVQQVLAGVEVAVPTNTQLLVITYRSTSAEDALTYAQAFADQFLAFREARARALVDKQIESIDDLVTERRAEQDQLSEDLKAAGNNDAEAVLIQTQLNAVATQINQLRARVAELRIGPFSPGQVVTPAALHHASLLDTWVAFAVAGALGGLVIAFLVAIVRSRLDSRVHHADDLVLSGRTLLGTVTSADARGVQKAFVDEGESLAIPESFKNLRVSILSTEHRRPVVLLVATGSADGTAAPKSLPALAASLASAGLETIVIDTLAVWPGCARREAGPRLADVLRAGGDPRSAFADVAVKLRLLAAAPGDSGDDLFMSPAMRRLLEAARQQADVILLVTGGIKHSRSRALADSADAIVTEVEQGVARYADARLDSAPLLNKDLGVIFVSRAESAAVSDQADLGRLQLGSSDPADQTAPDGDASADRAELTSDEPEPESDQSEPEPGQSEPVAHSDLPEPESSQPELVSHSDQPEPESDRLDSEPDRTDPESDQYAVEGDQYAAELDQVRLDDESVTEDAELKRAWTR